MNYLIRRRASLGLAVYGPFSRNRRRQSLREFIPHLIALGIVAALATFLAALFS